MAMAEKIILNIFCVAISTKSVKYETYDIQVSSRFLRSRHEQMPG